MKYYWIVFLLNLGICASAQVHKGFRWIDKSHAVLSVDLSTGELSKETLRKEKAVLGKIQQWDSLKKELPSDFEVNLFSQKGKTLLTIPGTGQLYTLDLPTLSLQREDQTFFRGYNFFASQFIRKDTLISIGGEGFWQKHSIMTFYNPKTQEWDLYKTHNTNPHPTDVRFSGYSAQQDAFFSAYLDLDFINSKKQVPFSVYSFRDKKWEVKGNVNQRLIDLIQKQYEGIWTGEYLILFKDVGLNNVLILDPFKNVFYKYDDAEGHFFMENRELYHRNGFLFSRSKIGEGRNNKMTLDSLSVKKMLIDAVKEGPIYDAEAFLRNIYLGLFVAVCIPALFLFYRKRKAVNGDPKFSETELVVVKELVNNPLDKKLTTVEINTLLQISDKSYDNQRQIRNRTISTINSKLFAFFDSREFISRIANTKDKRMMDYFIHPEIKQKEVEKLQKLL